MTDLQLFSLFEHRQETDLSRQIVKAKMELGDALTYIFEEGENSSSKDHDGIVEAFVNFSRLLRNGLGKDLDEILQHLALANMISHEVLRNVNTLDHEDFNWLVTQINRELSLAESKARFRALRQGEVTSQESSGEGGSNSDQEG